MDPKHARSYRGLGMLYEKVQRNKESAAAYAKYLELAPEALDAGRVKTRMEALQRALPQ